MYFFTIRIRNLDVTKDQKIVKLPYLNNSYGGDPGAEIDFFLKKAIKLFNEKGYETEFCCSGHTDQKGTQTIDCELSTSEKTVYRKYIPRVYILFKKNYNLPHQQLFNKASSIDFLHCGTLMGIKKACRKAYRLAKTLPDLRSK